MQRKNWGVHLHDLCMRDTYAKPIINDYFCFVFKAPNKSYQMTYAV